MGKNETSFDMCLLYDIDFGGQIATGSNDSTSALSTNTESTGTHTEQHDDTSEMYTNRMSEDTTRLHFGRSPNETRMQTSRYGLYNQFKRHKKCFCCSCTGNNYFVTLKG